MITRLTIRKIIRKKKIRKDMSMECTLNVNQKINISKILQHIKSYTLPWMIFFWVVELISPFVTKSSNFLPLSWNSESHSVQIRDATSFFAEHSLQIYFEARLEILFIFINLHVSSSLEISLLTFLRQILLKMEYQCTN